MRLSARDATGGRFPPGTRLTPAVRPAPALPSRRGRLQAALLVVEMHVQAQIEASMAVRQRLRAGLS